MIYISIYIRLDIALMASLASFKYCFAQTSHSKRLQWTLLQAYYLADKAIGYITQYI